MGDLRAMRKGTVLSLVFLLMFGLVMPCLGGGIAKAQMLDEEQNLIVNGDFEKGDLSGWNTGGNSKFSLTDEVYHSGSYGLKITSANQDYHGIKSTVPVNSGTDYTLTFYAKGTGGSYFKVLAGDESTLKEGQTSTSTDWKAYSLDFNSGGNNTIIVYVSDIKGEAFFDDFMINAPRPLEIPEVSNVVITGDIKVTGTLTGNYDYSQPSGVTEGYSILKWFQSAEEDGEYTAIPGATGKNYMLTAVSADMFIKLKVTPIDSQGVAGEEVWSDPVGPVAKADMTDELLHQIYVTKQLRDQSVKGDGVGQYPEVAWDELNAAITKAQEAAENLSADEALLLEAMHALLLAVQVFDQSRATLSSSFEHFITVSGDKLMDGTKEFRFISYNYPGALFNEDEQGGIDPTSFEQEDAIRTIQQVGGKVFRTYSLTVRDKNDAPNVVRHIDGPGVINEEAFRSMDKLLQLANQYEVRVVIPFIDNWDWPPGGITDFAAFRGKQRLEFYTDPQLIEDFEQVMDQVLNHINVYTGVRYKDDPAILAWETGNELMTAPEWMSEIAKHYKQVNTKQLLISGNQMDLPHNYTNITEAALNDPNIDIVKSHYYSGNYAARVKEDKARTVGKKPFLVGEFGFKPTREIEAMLNAVIDNGVSGAMIWSLRPHSNQGGFIRHDEYEVDGLLYRAYHWPGMPSGDDLDETNVLKLMREKAYAIQGLNVPAIPQPKPAPELFATDSVSELRWRGSTGASSYKIERAESVNGPWEILAEGVLDDVTPGETIYSDITAKSGTAYYYRVKGVNSSGESDWSDVLGPVTAKYVLIDDLKGASKQYYYDHSSIVYRTPGSILSFEVNAELSAGASSEFKFFLSADGLQFDEITPLKVGAAYVWEDVDGAAYNHLKIEYPGGIKNFGIINKVAVEYLGDGTLLKPVQPLLANGVLTDPMNDFSFLFMHDGNLIFDREEQDKAGGDESRLIRSDAGGEASLVYRTLGDMRSFKLETYELDNQGPASQFSFYGSKDGKDYSELEVEANPLGGNWHKVNYEEQNLPEGIKFLKIGYPNNGGRFPQISKLQIGVGDGIIAFPSEYPAQMIENGERYGGEGLLLAKTYHTEAKNGTVNLSLSKSVKYAGDYALKVDFVLGSAQKVGFSKEVGKADRSAFDTLQFWIKPDGFERLLTLELEGDHGAKWTKNVTVSGSEPVFVNLPLGDFTKSNVIQRFALYIQPGKGPDHGTIYMDDIQFIQTRVIDNFDVYTGNAEFDARYSHKNPAGNLQLSLSGDYKADGDYSMKMNYDFGGDGYGGVITSLPNVDWSAYDTVKFWVQPDDSDVKVSIQLRVGSLEYMEASVQVEGGSGPQYIEIPFSDFDYPSWYGGSGTLDPRHIVEFNIYLGQVSAQSGTLYVDQIELLNSKGPGTDPGTDPGTKPGTNPGTGSGSSGGSVSNRAQPSPTMKADVRNGSLDFDAPDSEAVELDVKQADIVKALAQYAGKVFKVSVHPSVKTKSVVLNLPLQELAKSMDGIEMNVGIATFTASKELFAGSSNTVPANLTLSLAMLEGAAMPAGMPKQVAAAFDFGLSLDGKAMGQFAGKQLYVSVPYKLLSNETPHQVVVYHLNDRGQYEVIKTAKFDPISGTVRFAAKRPGVYGVSVASVSFKDTVQWTWAADAIQGLAAKEIVQGNGAGQFNPGSQVTRAEFAAMLANALDLEGSAEISSFKDVGEDSWYTEPIRRAVKAGIVLGKSDGSFGVNESITRQEMAVMLDRAVRYAQIPIESSAVVPFADQDAISGYAKPAVAEMRKGGLIQGMDGKFEPAGSATRAQAATVVYRLLNLMN